MVVQKAPPQLVHEHVRPISLGLRFNLPVHRVEIRLDAHHNAIPSMLDTFLLHKAHYKRAIWLLLHSSWAVLHYYLIYLFLSNN